MTKPETNLDILTRAFLALPKADRKRLKFHLDRKTPVFCGSGARDLFINEKGFA